MTRLLIALFASTLLGGCADDSSGSGGESGTTAARSSASVGANQSCSDLPVCEGDAMTPASGCLECAVLGDASLARDGGACRDDYVACFGAAGDCSAGHPGCCAFVDCLLACPDDVSGTPSDEFLDCVCDNTAGNCNDSQSKDSCLGKSEEGGRRYIEWVACIYLDVCETACD